MVIMAKGKKSRIGPVKSALALGLFALSLGLTSIFTACTPMVPQSPHGAYQITADPAEFDQLLSNAEVVCESKDPQNCPSFAGMLAIKGQMNGVFGIGQCSAFLFNEDYAITNSHCLPEELRKSGARCTDKIRMIFPESGIYPRESVACAQIVWASEISAAGQKGFAEKPDFAVLQLKRKVKRQGTSLNRIGLPEGTKLKVFAIDPNSVISIRGILRAKDCTSVQKTWLLPTYQDEFHSVASFSGCEIIHGNSGSPAVDENGFLRAIAHASIASATYDAGPIEAHLSGTPITNTNTAGRSTRCDDRTCGAGANTNGRSTRCDDRKCEALANTNSEQPQTQMGGALAATTAPAEQVQTLLKRAPRTFNTISLMTNAACLEVPNTTGIRLSVLEIPERCGQTADADQARSEIELSIYRDSFKGLFEKWSASLAPKELSYFLARSGVDEFGRPLASPAIECVNEDQLDQLPLASDGTVTITYTQPMWALEYDFDANYRRLGHEIALGFDEIRLKFSPQDLIKRGRTDAVLKRGALTAVEVTYPISSCF